MHNVTARAGVFRGCAGRENCKHRGGTPLPPAATPSKRGLLSCGKIEPLVFTLNPLSGIYTEPHAEACRVKIKAKVNHLVLLLFYESESLYSNVRRQMSDDEQSETS